VAAKFEIRSPKSGEYNWVLLSQGRTLATGESYKTKASAEKAIASMRAAAGNAAVVDLTLPPPRTPAGAGARTTGGAVGRAVVTTGRAVAQVGKVAAQALTEATESATNVTKAKEAVEKAKKSKGKGKKSGR
jgi:uncharacterized protein YegP (UPF0339 family)